MADEDIRAALAYHEADPPGKIAIVPTKPVANQHDLAHWPIPQAWRTRASPSRKTRPTASKYTARANLVGVITNGTAVLGLGDIGPLASKPVMEGKSRPVQEIRRHRLLGYRSGQQRTPTRSSMPRLPAWSRPFGGINLEDIKAPECFEIERRSQGEDEYPSVP